MEMKPIAYLHPYGVKGLKHARDTGITQWATMCHPTAEGHGDLTKVGQPVPVYLGDELMGEIKRLREGLALIECEPVNAEYMARNILDGLPAYHDTVMECEAGCKCKTAVPPAPTLHKSHPRMLSMILRADGDSGTSRGVVFVIGNST